jgi:Skp family chaperone for outer membrane proteins
MVPGRRWTWQLDSEWSRERLDELQRDLIAFRDADVAFEESLSPEQRSKFNSHMTATRELFQHLERDAQNLDDELRKDHPTRWHVANDISDMRKEINRWRKLHRRLAEDLGMRP